MSVEEIHTAIDAKRAEQRRLAQAAQSAANEERLHQLDVEIHDLKAELLQQVAKSPQCQLNSV